MDESKGIDLNFENILKISHIHFAIARDTRDLCHRTHPILALRLYYSWSVSSIRYISRKNSSNFKKYCKDSGACGYVGSKIHWSCSSQLQDYVLAFIRRGMLQYFNSKKYDSLVHLVLFKKLQELHYSYGFHIHWADRIKSLKRDSWLFLYRSSSPYLKCTRRRT